MIDNLSKLLCCKSIIDRIISHTFLESLRIPGRCCPFSSAAVSLIFGVSFLEESEESEESFLAPIPRSPNNGGGRMRTELRMLRL